MRLLLRGSLILALAAPAAGYEFWTTGIGAQIKWQAGSPALWDNPAQTLTWKLNSSNFPVANVPDAARTGAALHNAFQSIQDVPGAAIKFKRGPNAAAGGPSNVDSEFHVYFTTSSTGFWGDLTGAFAVTMPRFTAAGVIQEMDIIFNAVPGGPFVWGATGYPGNDPPGFDIEVTMIHEALHAIGLLHPIYYYSAVWPVGRSPEVFMNERAYAPDDRAAVAVVYPEAAPFLGTITGTAALSPGGAPVERAVVVATDADGVPQATVVTNSAGTFTISVPAGTYTVTLHHHVNSTYGTNGDIDFTGATNFIDASTAGPAAVAAGGSVAVALTATPGTPTLTLNRLKTNAASLQKQVQFWPRGFAGTLQLEITGGVFTAADISSLSLGPGITVTGPITTSASGGATLVNAPVSVDLAAATGLRNIALLRTSGERLFLPAYLMVLGTGGLTVANGPDNPPVAGVPAGTLDHPVLQAELTATSAEDVRIRELTVDVAGTGAAIPNVKLWIDSGTTPGQVDAGDVRVLTSAAYANGTNPPDETLPLAAVPGSVAFSGLGISVPAGQSVRLLVTFDMPASGTGSYTASIQPSGFDSADHLGPHGMQFGDVVAPAGTATGGTQNLGVTTVVNPGQFRVTGGAQIPAGGFTPETQVEIRATVTSATGTPVGLDVEIRPLGTPFSNTPTASAAAASPSGSTVSVVQSTGLSSGTSYHWQVRGTTGSGPGPWASFGANPESEVDFNVDLSTNGDPAGLGQFDLTGAAVPAGGTARRSIALRATTGTNSLGYPVRLEVEVMDAGGTTVAATLRSPPGAGGSTAEAAFQPASSGDFHWRARTVSAFGAFSSWVEFQPGTSMDFHLEAVRALEAEAGCVGAVSGRSAGGIVLVLAALALVPFRRRAWPAALFLFVAPAAWGQEEGEPEAGIDLGFYTGGLFIDTEFEALGTDGLERKVEGRGVALGGIDVLFRLGEEFRAGFEGEAGFWSDARIFGAGPVLAWRFAAADPGEGGHRAAEHFLKAAVLYQKLDVDERDFGDFEPAVGGRLGYELRVWLGGSWSLTLGADWRYARFDFEEDVLEGDDSIGGHGFFIGAGLTLRV